MIGTQEDHYLTMQAPVKSVTEEPMTASQVKREIDKIDAACASTDAQTSGAATSAAGTAAGTDNDTVRSPPSKTAKLEKMGGA